MVHVITKTPLYNTSMSERCQAFEKAQAFADGTNALILISLSSIPIYSQKVEGNKKTKKSKEQSRSGPPVYAVGERRHWLQLN